MRLLLLAAVLGTTGCLISPGDGPGRACVEDAECPEAYGCVAGADGERTCEVVYPPRPSPSSADGGMDGGLVPTYCQDIQPILAAHCASCHGEAPTAGAPAGFRLDYYAPPTAGGVPGARAKAERIKARASDLQSMPPPGYPKPTASQRALLSRWVLGGAPECAPPDAGTPGGTP